MAEQQTVACESLQDIINIANVAVTANAPAVTALGGALDNAAKGLLALNAEQQQTLRASRAAEKAHYDFLIGAGAKPLTTTFTLPDPALVTDYDKFFTAVVQEETRETALGIAAMNAFTVLQRPDLVKVMFQYAAEESEHRLLANYALGTRPANDHGFAPALYANAANIVADLKKVGIIGGSGPAATYPVPGQIDPTNVIERTPGGPVVACAAPAPSASPTRVPTMTPMPSTPTPMPMPGLPNTGSGGAAQSDNSTGLLGLLGLGAAAAGALALRRNRQPAASVSDEER